MRLRLLAVLIVVAVATSCTMWKEKQSASWKSATGPEAYERLLWQEITQGNWPEVERHLAPTFTEVTPNATLDRPAAVNAWKKWEKEQVSLGEFNVQPAGDAMVVSYVVTSGASRVRMLTVWQQVKGGWMAIAHAETGM